MGPVFWEEVNVYRWVWSMRLRGGLVCLKLSQECLRVPFSADALAQPCLAAWLLCRCTWDVQPKTKTSTWYRDLTHHSGPWPNTSVFRIFLYQGIFTSSRASHKLFSEGVSHLQRWWRVLNYWERTLHLVDIYCTPGVILSNWCHSTFHNTPVICACKISQFYRWRNRLSNDVPAQGE